ncbi:MAG: AbrB/MazE/SpoVT family DNA-binding domain-containing protein [Candidatus Thiodiazotropha sp. (ex Dulcina madagascariensis)]|nr:AbrB/MazE/SpoVT family DNA-binding domain-containing protein [Candidatus Thiodiazotropha sp. (ex Dulcina madagascariensis)]
MSAATITSKGQITIPKEIRDSLDLHTGDKINFIIDDQGKVSFVPATRNVTTLKGIVTKPDKPVSIEDMKATVRARGHRL